MWLRLIVYLFCWPALIESQTNPRKKSRLGLSRLVSRRQTHIPPAPIASVRLSVDRFLAYQYYISFRFRFISRQTLPSPLPLINTSMLSAAHVCPLSVVGGRGALWRLLLNISSIVVIFCTFWGASKAICACLVSTVVIVVVAVLRARFVLSSILIYHLWQSLIRPVRDRTGPT